MTENKFLEENKFKKNESREKENKIRLNVWLQEHGVASRRKADELIQFKKVKVNGKIITELGTKIEATSIVSVDGIVIKNFIPKATYLFYKPDLYLTSRVAEDTKPSIFSLKSLTKLPKNVQAVGRLDFRSEGLLILTNDGDLALALTHPRYSVEKKYACLIAENLLPDESEQLRKGVMLDDGVARALSVRTGTRERLNNDKRGQWIEIIVTEGRNRLVRRMIEALGHKVIKLVRIGIGDVELPMELKPGEIRSVSPLQITMLNQIKQDMYDQKTNKIIKKFSKTPKISIHRTEYADYKSEQSFIANKKREERLQKREEIKQQYRIESSQKKEQIRRTNR